MANEAVRRLLEAIAALPDKLGGKFWKKAPGHDSPFPWPNDQWHCTAIHEAGHALVAWSTITTTEVSSIVVRADGGVTRRTGRHALWLGTATAHWEDCATSLGGIAAECFAYGKFRSGECADDLLTARARARSLHADEGSRGIQPPPWGQSDANSALEFAKMFTDHAPPRQLEIIRLAHNHARSVLKTNQAKLRALALEAAARHRLDAADIARILGPRPRVLR